MSKKHELSFEESCEIVKQGWKKHIFGTLTDKDIISALYSNDIFIYPFENKMLTGVGYNLRPSELIISTRTGMPLQIYQKDNEQYVMVSPHDTVLISTMEYVSVKSQIMGTFHSRVSIVSEGFGHISTTLDPNWHGPLLIALNNPSSSKKKLVLSVEKEKIPFATLIFYHTYSNAERFHDNKPNRIDILMKYRAKPSSFRRFIFAKSYKHYEEFINELVDLSKSHDTMATAEASKALVDAESIIEQLQELLVNAEGHLPQAHEINVSITNCHNYYIKQSKNPSVVILREVFCIAEKVLSEITETKCISSFLDVPNFLKAFNEYLNCCLIRIANEKAAIVWENTYEQIIEYSQSKLIHNRLLNWILEKGATYCIQKVMYSFTIILIGWVVYTTLSDNLEYKELIKCIAAPVFTALIGFVLQLFKREG